MTKNRDDIALLDDILFYIERIERILVRTPRDDILLMSAIRAIEVIGEAVHHLSDVTKSMNNSMPWRDIVNMRNLLIHGYFEVDDAKVWQTCEEDIPLLKTAIMKMQKDI
jgi:uncharacterized protein with HEPN domain